MKVQEAVMVVVTEATDADVANIMVDTTKAQVSTAGGLSFYYL